MAKLLGNYTIPGKPAAGVSEPTVSPSKEEAVVSEFERRAFERLGGSIAFVMKGKNAVWAGEGKAHTSGGAGNEEQPQHN